MKVRQKYAVKESHFSDRYPYHDALPSPRFFRVYNLKMPILWLAVHISFSNMTCQTPSVYDQMKKVPTKH
jgi:hypothetical protein